MPGPKYVDNFEFPSSFGFTGSATDKQTVIVRAHERRRYQRGGAVESDENRKAREAAEKLERDRKAKEEAKRKSEGPVRAKTTDPISALRGTSRRELEAELGLKRGGPARKKSLGGHVKYAEGGDVAQDKRLIKRAMDKHVAAPPPRGHGVKRKG